MASLTFSNTSSGNNALFTTTNDNGWCAYLLAKGINGPASGQLTLTDFTAYPGYLLLAANAPGIDINTFITDFYNLYPMQTYQTGSIAWLLNPGLAPSTANTLQLALNGSSTPNTFSVLTGFNYNFGNNYATFFIGNNNVTLTLDVTNNRLLLTTQQGNNSFSFTSNNNGSSSKIMGGLEIPLTGIGRGRIRFILGLSHAADFKSNAFDVSNKYFFYNAANTNVLTELSYGIILPGSLNEYILTQASIYPCDLHNAQGINTYFAFTGQTYNSFTQQNTNTVLNSNYLVNYGYPLSLVPYTAFTTDGVSINYPDANSALLVLSERSPTNPTDSWYMVPAGGFALTLNTTYQNNVDDNKQVQLMCGLGSTETISFTPQFTDANNTITGTGDRLLFKPAQTAFAPMFPIKATGNKVGSNTTQKWLGNSFITAWVGVVMANSANTPVVYHAQPQGAALFAPDHNSSSALFNHINTDSGVLSAANKPIYFPLVPYGTATATPSLHVDIGLFEQQILNPKRKATIAAQINNKQIPTSSGSNLFALKGATSITSTSPQGFYINANAQTGEWNELRLASNQFMTAEGKLSPVFNLAFTPPSAIFQTALQSNQLFLVVSYNPNDLLGTFSNIMEIAEWPFKLDVPKESVNGNYNNVLIFKFCTGTLIDKVQNIQGWNMPDTFNDTSSNGLPNLSMWLQEYIQNGIDRYSVLGDNDYASFYNIATNPNWQGVISLAVDISLQDFPIELQGLLAGIDLNRFNAHHFGINMSIVNNSGGTVTMQPTSSLFGLIDYEDPTFTAFDSNPITYQQQAPINGSVDYDFNVLKLKVVFINSKIYNYNSYLSLTVNKLFGEKVNAANRQNLMVLTGTYENHNGVPTYTFTNTSDNVLNLNNSSIITDVEIVKASFVTIVPQDGNTSNMVQAKFSFWGFINYNSLQGFDLFSFGAEDGSSLTSFQGLSYSNLYIDLSFPLADSTQKTFTFDINHMAFDVGQSTPRKDSLYAHFPLQLTGITSGDSTNTPTSQGYLNVAMPELQQQQSVSGLWYALVFNLNMGTSGSLASSAGFNSTFMMAWGVGAKGAWAGVKLPGVNPQAPSFSLQGVLKLDIGSIMLQKATGTTSTAYLMKINNIALKLFSLSFPPGGNISFMLFGNPASDAQPESLGWYGAYIKSS